MRASKASIFPPIVNDGGRRGGGYDLHQAIEVAGRVTRIVFASNVILERVFARVQISTDLTLKLDLQKREEELILDPDQDHPGGNHCRCLG